jgi:hypothetical protein
VDDDAQEVESNPLEAKPPRSYPPPRSYVDLSPTERAEFDRRMAWMAALAGKRDCTASGRAFE